jgi:hypothetical protein
MPMTGEDRKRNESSQPRTRPVDNPSIVSPVGFERCANQPRVRPALRGPDRAPIRFHGNCIVASSLHSDFVPRSALPCRSRSLRIARSRRNAHHKSRAGGLVQAPRHCPTLGACFASAHRDLSRGLARSEYDSGHVSGSPPSSL